MDDAWGQAARSQEDQWRKRSRELARRLFESAGRAGINHEAMRAYLRGAGVAVDRLPGGSVPDELRWCWSVDAEVIVPGLRADESGRPVPAVRASWPAMLARVVDPADGKGGALCGVKAVYMSASSVPVEVRHAAFRRSKREAGEPGAGVCGLEEFRAAAGDVEPVPRRRHPSLGQQERGQGSVWGRVTPLRGAWAPGIVPEGVVVVCGPVGGAVEHGLTLLAATGLTVWVVHRERPGHGFVPEAAAPAWLENLGGGQVRDLVIVTGAGADKDLKAAQRCTAELRGALPWLAVHLAVVTPEALAAGPEAVRACVVGDRGWRGCWDPVGDGGGSGTGGTGRVEVSKGGSGDGGGGAVDVRPWRSREFSSMPILEDEHETRARRFLWERCRIQGAGRFALARWNAKWWWFEGGAYREVEDEWLRAVVWEWMAGFRIVKRSRAVRMNPTSDQVAQVMTCLSIDTWVVEPDIPAWLPAVLDQAGAPRWGVAIRTPPERRYRAGGGVSGASSLVGRDISRDPRMRMIFLDGVLNVARLLDESLSVDQRVALDPHTPDLFSTTCLPFVFPSEALRSLLRGDVDRGDIYQRLCPHWWRWLSIASRGEDSEVAGARWEGQLAEMLGDTISPDRSMEVLNCVVGLGGGGKGVIEDAVKAIIGEGNYEALDTMALTDKFGLAHLVGKSAALMPDAHFAGLMQAGPFVNERLKAMSGQGVLPVRDMYQKVRSFRLTCRVWIFCNDEPVLSDHSGALAKRMVFLPITKGYRGTPQEDRRIKAAVPDEAPGILLFAIEGMMRLWKRERRMIEVCPAGELVAEGFEDSSAPLIGFRNFWLERIGDDGDPMSDPDLLTPVEIYEAYCSYLDEEYPGRTPLSQERFLSSIKWHLDTWEYVQPRREGGRRPRLIPGWKLSAEGRLGLQRGREKASGTTASPAGSKQGRMFRA